MTAIDARQLLADLREVARVASVMVDGELAHEIVTERAMGHIREPHPDHPFMSGDYYDVDHDRFLLMKQTLLRLERLVDGPCGSALWIPVSGTDHVTCVVQNHQWHRYYRFGVERMEPAPEMRRCLERGKVVAARTTREFVTALAPVFDSLGDVAGLVEFTCPNPDTGVDGPAWS